MRLTRWTAPAMLALGALLSTAEAQGKGTRESGHGERSAKPAPAPARGGGKGEGQSRSQVAQDRQRGANQARVEKSRGQDRGESRGGERGRSGEVSATERGKAVERGNPSFDRDRLTGRENARARANEVSEAGGLVVGAERRGRLFRTVTVNDLAPRVRVFATSARPAERYLGRAVGLAAMRGLSDDDLVIVRLADRVNVKNRRGDVLLDLDDDKARSLGWWRVVTQDDEGKEGSPSFCRSGAGHPVWGRQWCVDKGFGLGMDNDIRWGRVLDPRDVVFVRPVTEAELRRDALARVLGDIVFNRLAAHALTLGLTDPLTGRWIGETTGPRVLLVNAGGRPVAEIVDTDRDDDVDIFLVALRPW